MCAGNGKMKRLSQKVVVVAMALCFKIYAFANEKKLFFIVLCGELFARRLQRQQAFFICAKGRG